MSERTGRLRVRAFVSSWFAVLAVLCLVLAGVGGWAVYTVHAAPGETVEQQQQVHWSVDGEFGHSAEVTRENPAFETGETLRNRSTYFIGASPVLDGQYVATYAGAGAEPASIELDTELVIRAVDGDTVFWENRTSLAESTTTEVEAGDTTSASFSLNASEVTDRRSAIEESLGQSPGEVETFVAVAIDVEGSVDGQPASLSYTQRLPMSVSDGTYTVGPAEAGTEEMTTTETVTVPREYGPFWSAGGPLLLLVGLAGLGALGAGRRRDLFEISPAERELLAYREERGEFDEWVVRMRLTDELRDRPRAEAESLSDLVDFAIDSDTGVVEDPETGTFVVVAEEFLAVYEPPALALERSDAADEKFDDVSEVAGDGEQEALFDGETPTDGDDEGEQESPETGATSNE